MANKNLYQRICDISAEVVNVEKNLSVSAGKSSYKAVSDYDVVIAVKKAEAKHGVCSFPVSQELVDTQVLTTTDQYGNQKNTFLDIVKMRMRFINADDPSEFFEVESFGRGLDTGDKGFGKASTYARKYCLLNTYKIATGEDPDKDASPENGVTNEKPATITRNKTANEGENKPVEQTSQAEVAEQSLLDKTLEKAIAETRGAKSEEELKKVWGKWKDALQTNRRFVNEVNRIKAELVKQPEELV